MAAPLTKRQTTKHIDSIQTSKLIKRVQDHVLEGEEMSQSQMAGAKLLLSKTMPDMKAIENSFDGDNVKIVIGSFVAPVEGE